MKDAQKPDHVSLNTLLNRLKEGRYVIPDFQRDFEWRPWDIKELMRSIFLDYYIGSLLLWKGKKENFDALSCEVIYGFDNTKGQQSWNYSTGAPDCIVLDGQQRLTALYYALVAPDAPLPNRASRAVYFVHIDKFMNEEYDEAFQYDWLSKRFNRMLNDREIQYQQHVFPLSIIGEGGWTLYSWIQGYQDYWKKVTEESVEPELREAAFQYVENAKDFGDHLKGITDEYQISYIELDRDIAVDKVCDIFTQINSRGIRLDVFDLINALLKPKGLQLKHMWREAEPLFEFVETEKMNVYVLQVMSILLQNYCSPKYLYYLLPGQAKQIRESSGLRRKEILVPGVDIFKKYWDDAVAVLDKAIKLLRHPQEFGVVSSRYLPYMSIIPVFSALQSYISTLPAHQRLNAQRKFRLWYWASVFTNRYSGAVESTSARDFMDVKAWLEEDLLEPPLVQEFKQRFKALELRKEIKRGSSVYNGIFNLLVLQGARDWMTGNIPQHDELDDHHIVPASWGAKILKNNTINSVLNRTPLCSDTNRKVIGDRLPNEYLPGLILENGEAQIRRILETHFISEKAQEILMRNPFMVDDFDDFLAERQRTIQDAIECLLIKERMDLQPQIRELDERLEKTELELRHVITVTLENDIGRMPQHIVVKAEERIKKASQKNAAMDIELYNDLNGLLEYCDLRELQEAVTSKVTWPLFESRFHNKDTLVIKFGQLAELRNGIRHSRTVDEITRKEGEASVLWFSQVLNKPQSQVESKVSELDV